MSATKMYWVEKCYPVATALVLSCVYMFSYMLIDSPTDFIDKLVNSALVVCATLLGFLLTITTILNAISSRRMEFLKSHDGGYNRLISYLKQAIWLNITTVTVAIVTPVLYAYHGFESAHMIVHSAIVFVIVFTWTTSIRFTSIFVKILSDQ